MNAFCDEKASVRCREIIRCREIVLSDVRGVVELLTEGFRAWRNRAFWLRAFARLSAHPTPRGFPKYGYLLESNGVPVGVLLLIFTSTKHGSKTGVRCNVSSSYLKSTFRLYGPLLALRALRHKGVTYFNITPAPWTLQILEAQGYLKYCKGAYLTPPLLSPSSETATVREAAEDVSPGWDLDTYEVSLLLEHFRYGCVSVICESSDGRHPFVFAVRYRYGVFPYAILLYCRRIADLARFARPLGRFLALRGILVIAVDANGAIQGLPGIFFGRYPKYFKGGEPPGLGDLAYSERALLGV